MTFPSDDDDQMTVVLQGEIALEERGGGVAVLQGAIALPDGSKGTALILGPNQAALVLEAGNSGYYSKIANDDPDTFYSVDTKGDGDLVFGMLTFLCGGAGLFWDEVRGGVTKAVSMAMDAKNHGIVEDAFNIQYDVRGLMQAAGEAVNGEEPSGP